MVIVGIYRTRCGAFIVNYCKAPSDNLEEIYLKDIEALMDFIFENFKGDPYVRF